VFSDYIRDNKLGLGLTFLVFFMAYFTIICTKLFDLVLDFYEKSPLYHPVASLK
jgi:hypothetical protein